MEIDKEKIQELLNESTSKVESIMKDTAAIENILQSAEQKLKDIPNIGEYVDDQKLYRQGIHRSIT